MNWMQKKLAEEQRAQTLADMKAILTSAETEKRDLTPEQSAKFDELSAKAEALKSQVDRFNRFDAITAATAATAGVDTRSQPGRDDVNTPEQAAAEHATEYRAQLDSWLRGGNPVELRALTVSGAGIVGDRPMQNLIVAAMKSYAGVIEAGAEVISTSTGNPFGIPTANDTTNVGILVGEGVTSDTTADPALGALEMKAYKFDSKWVKVSLELLRDAAYNVETFVTSTAGERIGRAFNAYATTGNGTGQPRGFVDAGTVGKTAAATNAITYEEWIDFEHSLDAAYRNSGRCKVQLHDLTLAALRKLKNPAGQYIWTPGAGGLPATLDGFGYIVNNSMDHIGSGAASVIAAIGDWQRYKVRVVAMPELIRANELFISDGLVGFKVFQRIDGQLADTTAVKLLKLKASA